MTFEAYLVREREAKYKNEYRSGEVFATAGGTPYHAELSMRMGFLFAKNCRSRTNVRMPS